MSFHSAARVLAVVLTLSVLPVLRAADEEKPNPIITKVKDSVKDPTKPFTLVVHLQVKEDAGEKFEAACAKAVKLTRKEKGCVSYELNRNAKMPAHYLMYERWKNLDALEAHIKSEHFAALLKEIGELMAAPPEVHVLVPAGD
jgi:quinol monooxygenase YgiN